MNGKIKTSIATQSNFQVTNLLSSSSRKAIYFCILTVAEVFLEGYKYLQIQLQFNLLKNLFTVHCIFIFSI